MTHSRQSISRGTRRPITAPTGRCSRHALQAPSRGCGVVLSCSIADVATRHKIMTNRVFIVCTLGREWQEKPTPRKQCPSLSPIDERERGGVLYRGRENLYRTIFSRSREIRSSPCLSARRILFPSSYCTLAR